MIIHYSHVLSFSHLYKPIPVVTELSVNHRSFVVAVCLLFDWFVCLFDSWEVCHHAISVKACHKPLSALHVHIHSHLQDRQRGRGREGRADLLWMTVHVRFTSCLEIHLNNLKVTTEIVETVSHWWFSVCPQSILTLYKLNISCKFNHFSWQIEYVPISVITGAVYSCLLNPALRCSMFPKMALL